MGLRLSPLKLLPLLPLLLPPLSLMLVLLSIPMPMLLMLREASSMPRMSSETWTTAIPTSTLPSRRLETPMVVSPEDTPMLMLRASCSMLTMLLMPLDSVSLTPDCLLPLSMTELHPPSTLSPWLPLYLMVSHLPLLRTPLRLLRPVLPISLPLSAPMLVCPPPTMALDISELDILELDTSELDTFTKERMQNCTDCMYFVMNIVGIS